MVQIPVFWPDATKDCLIIKDVQTPMGSSDFFLRYLQIVVTPKASAAFLMTVFIKLALSAEFQEGILCMSKLWVWTWVLPGKS